MSEPRFESPLARQAAPQGLSISIREIADRGMIDVRGDAGDPRFLAAVTSVLGLDLPLQPRSSANTGDVTVLWLSVDQWLVLCRRDAAPELARRLKEAVAGVHSLVVDVSDARAIIRLKGEGVREVLMKGAPVDLLKPARSRESGNPEANERRETLSGPPPARGRAAESAFTPGTVRRVSFGEIAALLHMVSDSPDTFDLYVFRSYAVFAWQWLLATARAGARISLFGPQPPPTA